MITKKQNTDFGIVLALALIIAGLWWGCNILFSVAAMVLLTVILLPVVFTPLSFLWYGLASILERAVSVVILTVIYFILVTPVGLLRRWFAKDAMQVRSFKKGKPGVFIVKDKTYGPEDMKNQY